MLGSLDPDLSAPTPSRSGLFFLLDRPYLPAFRVLAYSLVKTGSLLDLPVTVITTDPRVAKDPVIQACADRIRVLSDEDLAEFRAINRDDIRDHLRHEEVPKYSFLKWLVFEDYGYDRHVYLDVDMVALQNCSDLATEFTGADVAAASRAPKKLRRINGERLPQPTVERNIRAFYGGSREWIYGINTGVLVLGRKMMRPEIRQELLDVRAENGFTFDQMTLGSWAEARPDIALQWLEPTWNVNQRMIRSIPALDQMQILSRTKFLHYISSKPWEEVAEPTKLTEKIWWNVANDAQRHYRDIGLKTGKGS